VPRPEQERTANPMASKRSAKSPRAPGVGADKQRPTISIGDRNARRRPDFSARLAKAHKEICAAYRNALLETGCTQAQAARGMDVTSNTAANYEHARTPVNVARVLAYPRLRKAFRRLLCTEHDSVPYIARKRGRSA
jgi:hypothetical protein